MVTADNLLFRCSSLGKIMKEPRSKSERLSETCKNYLVELFVSEKYGRTKDISSKYTTKGLMVEEDSLTLYSRYKKEFYLKNEERFKNEFIEGTPDVTVPDERPIKIIKDIKSSWDIFTFFANNGSSLNKDYYWQLQGYMALTGADYSVLCYCLINTPDILIQDEKRKLIYKMGVIDDMNPLYVEACEKLEKLMIYDDIPLEERVIEVPIERNDPDIFRMYNRILECREYINEELINKPQKNLPFLSKNI